MSLGCVFRVVLLGSYDAVGGFGFVESILLDIEVCKLEGRLVVPGGAVIGTEQGLESFHGLVQICFHQEVSQAIAGFVCLDAGVVFIDEFPVQAFGFRVVALPFTGTCEPKQGQGKHVASLCCLGNGLECRGGRGEIFCIQCIRCHLEQAGLTVCCVGGMLGEYAQRVCCKACGQGVCGEEAEPGVVFWMRTNFF